MNEILAALALDIAEKRTEIARLQAALAERDAQNKNLAATVEQLTDEEETTDAPTL